MGGPWTRLALTCAAVAALLLAGMLVDVRFAGVRPINERDPSFAPVDRLRTGIVLAAAFVFVGGVLLAGRTDRTAQAAGRP